MKETPKEFVKRKLNDFSNLKGNTRVHIVNLMINASTKDDEGFYKKALLELDKLTNNETL